MAGTHILVVDDDQMSRSLYLHLLNAEGYRVTSASDGQEALVILDRFDDIDLIITDIEMPVISGLELIKSLKEKNCNIPVLVISSSCDRDKLFELNDLGYKHYLSKPVRLQVLRESVKNLIAHKTGENDL